MPLVVCHAGGAAQRRPAAAHAQPEGDAPLAQHDAIIAVVAAAVDIAVDDDVARDPAVILVARGAAIVGVITYRLLPDACEVLVLNSLEPGLGIGRALLDAVAVAAREAGKARLALVTTNDNLPALRLYQRYGMRMAVLRPGAVERSRAVKPGIPATGIDGIPIRDELELELRLV